MRWPLLLCLVLVAGCRSIDARPSPDSTWVAQTLSGGVQCDPASDYEPPDTRALLEANGVRVLDVAVEELGLIALCGASAYAAIHYALIDGDDVETALDLGFARSDEPPDWARRTQATDPRG